MQIIQSTALKEWTADSPQEFLYSDRFKDLKRPLKVLLIKPYQNISALLHSPPLGLLYLVSTLRERFGDTVDIELLDMKLAHHDAQWMEQELMKGRFEADVMGVSALNFEAQAAKKLADVFKAHNEDTITILGGPYALHRSEELLNKTQFDWVFSGAADNTFPEAIARLVEGEPFCGDIAGMSYKLHDGGCHVDVEQANIKKLDDLPLPAWDLIDFDAYAKKTNMMGMLRGRRYATLFTSRGCPYLCNYCHDIFSKKFTHRSPEDVLAEIEMLYEQYGVDEFQIVDDIFNLHKPRLKKIMGGVAERWPGKIKFTFPNGVRGDILDDEVLDALKEAGTYALKIAVETVTPRLQTLIEKDLDVEKTRWAIDACNERGIMTGGFFMLGFPSETEEELKATIDFALKSKLTVAHFFIVVPQKETPLYDLAMNENADSLEAFTAMQEGENTTYYSAQSWYQMAYGTPLNKYLTYAFVRFYFSPYRILRILRQIPFKSLLGSVTALLGIILRLRN